MKVLVTGAAGYLGAHVVRDLLERGADEVTALDNFSHRVPSLSAFAGNPRLKIINGDAREVRVVAPLLRSCDAVIALAAIVGASACDRDLSMVESTNVGAIRMLSDLMAHDQVLIYPNTNSGYGRGGEDLCTEESALEPVSNYGSSKVKAEAYVLQRKNGYSFRLATLFGPSPRMRLDLMVNDWVYRAVRDRSLVLFEGAARRNFLHVRDAASLMRTAAYGYIRPGVYNAGDSSANMTKRALCGLISREVPGFEWTEAEFAKDPDQRDYVISNAKLEKAGWLPTVSITEGIRELITLYQQPFESGNWRNA